jgi:hypothetical protein
MHHTFQPSEKTLIIGRGPSAYATKLKVQFDRIIKLKKTNVLRNTDALDKCDILVFYGDEIKNNYPEYKTDLERTLYKEIWIFDAFSKYPEFKLKEQYAHNVPIRVMNNEFIKNYIKGTGLEWSSYPRLTTGMATIIQAVQMYRNPIYIKGFDNIVNNANVGEFDNLSRLTNKSAHSIHLEHKMLNKLIQQGRVKIVT